MLDYKVLELYINSSLNLQNDDSIKKSSLVSFMCRFSSTTHPVQHYK